MKRVWLFVPLAVILVVIGLIFVIYHELERGPVQPPMVGQAIPSLELKGLDEGEIYLSELTGQPYVLHVGSSWCEDCQDEISVLNDIAKQDISIVAILYRDKMVQAQEWLESIDNPFEMVFLDEDGEALVNLGGTALPITYVIDEDGIVQAVIPGKLKNANQVLEKL